MTNAEWLIKNEIPFKNINIHFDYIKMIANIYVKGYEKIIYNLEPNDPNDETQEMHLLFLIFLNHGLIMK